MPLIIPIQGYWKEIIHYSLLTSTKTFSGCSSNQCILSVCAWIIYELCVCLVNFPSLWHIHPRKCWPVWINCRQQMDDLWNVSFMTSANSILLSVDYDLYMNICWNWNIWMLIEFRGMFAIWCLINSLSFSDAIWQCRSGSTLAQVMACCLTATSHYLNQCWLIIRCVLLHSSESNFTSAHELNVFKDYTLKLLTSPWGSELMTILHWFWQWLRC